MSESSPPPLFARVYLGRQAQRVYDKLTKSEQQRLWRIVAVIKNAPEDGQFVRVMVDGAVFRQMTGSNMHVSYLVRSWSIGRTLNIVSIEIADWVPRWQ